MKKSSIIKGIVVLALLSAMVLSSCGNDTVQLSKVDDPKVKGSVITGGVKLTWAPILDAPSYQIWRKSSEKDSVAQVIGGIEQGSLNDDGIYEYLDIASYENELKSNTKYSYTVQAVPINDGKWIGKGKVDVKTGDIPAQGAEAAAPAKVELAIKFDDLYPSFTVTVTPATSNAANCYWISISGDGGYLGKWVTGAPSDPIVWTRQGTENGTEDEQACFDLLSYRGDSTYTVEVSSRIGYDVYYARNTYRLTKTYKPLFDSGSWLSTGNTLVTTGSVANYFANSIDISNVGFLKDVSYTLERAVEDVTYGDKAYVVPAKLSYSPVATLYKGPTTIAADTVAVAFASNFDIFGNPQVSTVYDTNLPLDEKRYIYRIAGTRDGVTSYVGTGPTTTNPYSYVSIGFTPSKSDGASTTIKFTPVATTKGLLKSADTIAVYYSVTDSAVSVPNFTEANKIVFTAAEYELGTGKDVVIPLLGAKNFFRKVVLVYSASGKQPLYGTQNQIY